jgi:hypothetical protein
VHGAGKTAAFCWTPVQTVVRGKEAADEGTLVGNLTTDRAYGGDARVFLLHARRMDPDYGQQTASGDTVRAGVALLPQLFHG